MRKFFLLGIASYHAIMVLCAECVRQSWKKTACRHLGFRVSLVGSEGNFLVVCPIVAAGTLPARRNCLSEGGSCVFCATLSCPSRLRRAAFPERCGQ